MFRDPITNKLVKYWDLFKNSWIVHWTTHWFNLTFFWIIWFSSWERKLVANIYLGLVVKVLLCCRRVALLAGGDALALLLFAAIGRFSHGLSVFDIETLHTADPFIAGVLVFHGVVSWNCKILTLIFWKPYYFEEKMCEIWKLDVFQCHAGWFLGAYFLGGYGEDGRGMKGLPKGVIATAKSWAVGIPVSWGPVIWNEMIYK